MKPLRDFSQRTLTTLNLLFRIQSAEHARSFRAGDGRVINRYSLNQTFRQPRKGQRFRREKRAIRQARLFKHVARAAIKASHGDACVLRSKKGDIADSADITHNARLLRRAEIHRVKSGRERRALTARGDIAAAEIRRDIYPGQFSESRGRI